jgi:hypothetical protein
MTSINEEEKVLRTDTRGRVRVPAERREELLNEFERSGISAMRFAKMAGINYATFANWRQKRRAAKAKGAGGAQSAPEETAQVESAGAGRPVRLFEAFMEPGKSAVVGGGLAIELPAGARMVVESPAQLRMAAELLAMLGQTVRREC